MARRPGTRRRWLSAAATPLLLAAGAPPPPAAPATADVKRSEPSRHEADAPDPALLDFLGRYGEAADDVDALGFDLPADAPRAASPPAEGKRR
jgi:hypothetical protein